MTKAMSAYAVCSGCGKKAVVASGFNAANLSRGQIAQCALALGWQAIPTIKCPTCVSGGQFFEMQILDNATGEKHIHRPFCKTLTEAFELTKKTYTNPEAFTILPPKRS